MEVATIDKPGGSLLVAVQKPPMRKEEMRADVYQLSRGNQEKVKQLLELIKGSDPVEFRRLQVMASQEVHGKNTLWEIWNTISHARLTERDQQLLLDFFDGPRFRPGICLPAISRIPRR